LNLTHFPSSEFSIETSNRPVADGDRHQILSKPGFGKYFTDHMVAIDWTLDKGWHAPRIIPYGPLILNPASLVLHITVKLFLRVSKLINTPMARSGPFEPNSMPHALRNLQSV